VGYLWRFQFQGIYFSLQVAALFTAGFASQGEDRRLTLLLGCGALEFDTEKV
jgi:hypothetical protein